MFPSAVQRFGDSVRRQTNEKLDGTVIVLQLIQGLVAEGTTSKTYFDAIAEGEYLT